MLEALTYLIYNSLEGKLVKVLIQKNPVLRNEMLASPTHNNDGQSVT